MPEVQGSIPGGWRDFLVFELSISNRPFFALIEDLRSKIATEAYFGQISVIFCSNNFTFAGTFLSVH